MEKRFRITVEGKVYIVAVEDITPGAGQGLYPDAGTMQGLAHAAAPAGAAPTAPVAAAPAAPAADPGDETAPLVGVVQSLHVTVGQAVTQGQRLVSLEAMKMITHVAARRAGTVTRIDVKPGDPVDAGQVLLSIG
jgi:biotin carboxyl carrier protein